MCAISVKNVCFDFNGNKILNGFCANVKYDNIYALLGSSGCGKTTLLRLILGRIKPKSGSIRVLGHNPSLSNSLISYMPQDCSLCPQFTVDQTFDYFSRILQISREDFAIRKKQSHELLDIPNGNRLVCELSGGEQRRVSLALTLLNNSCLIILDEPTVGIDMIITSRIWKYLNNRCKEGLTVLFITQYVEEATHANRVGFMRNGRMLEENSPSALMKEYKELRLEKIFLKLCQKEDNQSFNNYVDLNNKNEQISMDSYQQIEKRSQIFPKRQNYSTALWILFVLIQRNILKLTRMGFPSLLVILLPAIQAIVFCLLFSKESIEVNVMTAYSFCLKIKILCTLRKPSIFDLQTIFSITREEPVNYRLIFYSVFMLQIKTAVFNEEIDPDYSKQLLSSLVSVERHTIEPIIFATLDEALNAIKRNEVIGVIHFKSNYTYAIDERIENFMDFDNQTIEESSLHLYLDNSIITYANLFMTSLKISSEKFLSKLFKEKKLPSIEAPIKVEKLKLTENLLPQDYYLPGFMLHMLYFSSMITSSLALILERKDGLFERSLIAGVRHELVFISHLITNALLSFIQAFLMIFIIFVIFTNKNEGSIVLIFCLFITQSINSISTGFLVSTLLHEEFHCLLIVASIAIPQFFSSGIIWPIESLDKPLRALFNFCPLTLPTKAVKDILFKGYDLTHCSIKSGLFVSFIPCIIFIGLSLILFKRR